MPPAKPIVPIVVGIGASAGGLDAFKKFFEHMPPDTGMAFVLVQHLDPQHKSLLVELLRPRMTMPVVEASDGTAVAENCVYVIPRNATLTIKNGVLHVVTPAPERSLRRPIDTFFAALAADQGERAAAIVLSGVGSDGSLGVKSIKEHGGLTLAQAEAEAEADDEAMRGMPWSATATGFVDFVSPIDAMPAKLIAYQRHLNGVSERKNGDGVQFDAAEHLSQIIALLRVRTGHDFGGYKSSTLGRRIQRRMQVLQINDITSYLEHLRADPDELDLLFGEILVGVTEFFRDPEAFDALAAVMRNVIADKGPDSHVRIWVPGCSTGEEVYSVAIMMREAKDARTSPKVAIFGTDIDPKAVTSARVGLYHKLPPGLSQERFERWFSKEGDQYRPTKEIRDLCVFSVHNLVKDPPFSKLDLICCRNLLIYFDTGLQHRAAQTFHYALRPGGYLFLGPSESATRDAKLFAVVDKKHRILQRLDSLASLPSVSAVDARTPHESIGVRPSISDTAVDKRVRRALEPYSPAYFVIDAGNEIIRFSGAETRHYLEPSSGPPSLNLFALLRTDLRQRVREALQEARAQHSSVARENLIFSIDGQNRPGTLIVEPIGDKREAGPWVVAFRDTGQSSTTDSVSKPVGSADVHALEQELRETKARLQGAISDMELHMEEARSAAEEYQSVNEELQSANEELETAKEEMQSVNEELQTVNAELQSKNETLIQLNSDLQNLMDSTQIAVVFLDQELRIKNFTPAIAQIFPLRAADRGRPLIQIVSNLIDVDLASDLSTVQRTLAMIEREVKIEHAEGRLTLLMRIRPYLTVDNRIDGAVITFVDINKIALAAGTEVARYQALSRASEDAIVSMSVEGVISAWSAAAERTFGYTSVEIVGRHISILVPEGLGHEQQGLLKRVRHGEKVTVSDSVRRRKDGSLVHVAISAAPILSAEKVPIGISKTIRDITEHRNALLISREFAHRTKNLLALVLTTMTQTVQQSMSVEDFTKRFEERLRAMSQAHDLLLAGDWRGAAVADLVRESLKPFIADQPGLEMHGPEVILTADAAQTLSLVLHELATNAAKFGALTKPEGRIAVDWQLDEELVDPRRFRITWRETGGPAVAPPQKTGFGHELISSLPEHELDAAVTLEYLPGGLFWSIDMPASGVVIRLVEGAT